jgi:hypothetical protein
VVRACTKCSAVRSLDEFYPDATKRDGHHTICKECVKADRRRRFSENPALIRQRNRDYYHANKATRRNYAKDRRLRVLAAYGGKCKCCGESQPEFLGIDHVNNDGESHRRQLAGYAKSIYNWLDRQGCPQDGRFQILCHNCNMAKGLYGGCPHQGPVPGIRRATPAQTKLWLT